MIKIDLTIIIVSYNTCNVLRRCLNHLAPFFKQKEVQIIIIDNNSTDGSGEMVRQFYPEALLIQNDNNLGFARANNQGLPLAKTEFIILLNSDAFISVESIFHLIEFMQNNKEVGICGPQLIYPDGSWQRSSGRIISPIVGLLDTMGITSLGHLFRKLLWGLGRGKIYPRNVGYIDGACMVIRLTVIKQIGIFDERYFFYCEDVDFCLRARRAGWKIVLVPKSQVIHLRGASYNDKQTVPETNYKRKSLEIYISTNYGKKAWFFYSKLMVWNFRVRYFLCKSATLFKIEYTKKCQQYRKMSFIFKK